MTTACPSRLGDQAEWCDCHGGATAKCLACDADVLITTWGEPTDDPTVWLIGEHHDERTGR